MPNDFTIHLDHARCIGAENCTHFAPATFETQNGQVVLLAQPHDGEAQIRAAASACPMQVIRLETNKNRKEPRHDG